MEQGQIEGPTQMVNSDAVRLRKGKDNALSGGRSVFARWSARFVAVDAQFDAEVEQVALHEARPTSDLYVEGNLTGFAIRRPGKCSGQRVFVLQRREKIRTRDL